MPTTKFTFAVLSAAFAPVLFAQLPTEHETQTPPEPQRVEIVAEREIDLFANYRAVFAGLRAAQAARPQLSPNAVVKFAVPSAAHSGNVRVTIVGNTREVLVASGPSVPFQFPMDEELANESARVVVAGGGSKPILTVLIESPSSEPLRWRLGDAQLFCAFITAARKDASTGMNNLVYGLFGSYTCRVPVPVNPSGYLVVAHRKDGKEVALKPKDGKYYFPTNLGSYTNESIIEARPLPAAASAPDLVTLPLKNVVHS